MKNTLLKKLILVVLASFSLSCSINAKESSDNSSQKPNILWLVSEDNSKHFINLYDENGASMPNIEKLADKGLIFDNAFSNAPVCSTARTTLATGAYGPRIGAQFHRAAQKVNLPKDLKVFSQILKEAGYYTTNNVKTDYNFVEVGDVWSESSKSANWQNRQDGQPFFHMQSWKETHEHKLHFPVTDIFNVKTETDPAKVELFPIYPDTANFRYTHARYLDQHKLVDTLIGKVITKLENDGLLEDTFIFYFGDHGGVLPASKGHIYERGLAIPLVVRIPENFKHLVNKDMQNVSRTRVEGFVNFVDFGPTILKLAGIEKSEQHDGNAFLGKDITMDSLNKRNTSFSYADRFDEKYDFARALRVGKYKYVRSYMPYYPDALFSEYRFKQTAAVEWRSLFRTGQLNSVQSAFFRPVAAERLYDIESDPHETQNLAQQSEFKSTLMNLRKRLNKRLKSMPDLSFYPESMLFDNAFIDSEGFANMHQQEISELIDIANLQYADYADVSGELAKILSEQSALKKYWALIVLSSFGEQAKAFTKRVKQTYKSDDNLLVKARAMEFLSRFEQIEAKDFVGIVAKSNSEMEKLELLNIATYLHDVHGYTFDVKDKALKLSGKINERYIGKWFEARQAHLRSTNFLVPYAPN